MDWRCTIKTRWKSVPLDNKLCSSFWSRSQRIKRWHIIIFKTCKTQMMQNQLVNCNSISKVTRESSESDCECEYIVTRAFKVHGFPLALFVAFWKIYPCEHSIMWNMFCVLFSCMRYFWNNQVLFLLLRHRQVLKASFMIVDAYRNE